MKPLYEPFDRIVQDVCNYLLPNGFDITNDSTKCDTFGKISKYYHQNKRVLVWAGGSDNTVFGDKRMNYMFRAWHDYVHITCNLDFSTEDEFAVMRHQIDTTRRFNIGRVLKNTEFELIVIQKLIEAEIAGQREYYNHTGEYVEDQRAFALEYLKNGGYMRTFQ